MTKLLEGFRIIESSMLLNGASTGMMLRDLGAEVIKIESPFLGDYLRVEEMFHLDLQVNKGKKSLALDLTTEAGRAVFQRLLQTADAFITNAVGDKNRKIGLAYDQLKALKPDIVYCQNTGFGAQGPYSSIPTHGLMMDALAGGLPMQMGADGLTHPDHGRVRQAGSLTLSADGTTAGGIYSAFQVAAALARRERTGKGCYIDVSSADAVLASAWLAVAFQCNNPERLALFWDQQMSEGVARYQWYETRDRKFVLFCPMETKFWKKFCELVGREDLVGRLHGVDLRRELQGVFHSRDLRDWIDLARKHSLPIGPSYRDLPEVAADPHIQARGILVHAQHPQRGPVTYVGQPAIVDGERNEAPGPPPRLGQDTDEVLADLGYSDAEVAIMRADGVIEGHPDLRGYIPDIYGGQGAG